ncbi:MAG TPA: hypothetical protein VIU33_04515, partial [Nitrospiria bacterium]
MIWQSLPVMTVIDLAIVSAACYLIYLLRRHHRSAQQLGLVPVLNVILAGVGLTALFYGSDLFIMYVLPLITSKPHAMQTMV